jgi:2-polyprenyl-3-methyl-5-hydroxy-6-metoxy-1,4-benzoquinol methylase
MSNTPTPKYQAFLGKADTFVTPDESSMFFGAHMARYRLAATFAIGKKVVDVGCGPGYGTASMAEAAAFAVGVDASREAIAIATAQASSRARFALMDARAMAIADNSFDVATCFEVVEHVDADLVEEIVRDVARCLRPDGLAMFSTPNIDVILKAGTEVPDFHVNNMNHRSFKDLLGRHFRHVEVWSQQLKGNPLYKTVRILDLFGLRYRLYDALGRASQVQAYRAMGVDERRVHTPDDYEFSKWFANRAGMLFAFCRK